MESSNLYDVDLGPEEALHALKSTATVLLLNVPPGTVVGIDQQAFTIGDKFLGVKMVPPGVHFISTTSCNAHGGFAPVVGFFSALGAGDVLVKQWDALEELLCSVDSDDEIRYKQGVEGFDFDHGLAPYDVKSWRQWRGLSKHITKETIAILMPVTGFISLMQEDNQMELTGKTPAEQKLLEQLGEAMEKKHQDHSPKLRNCFYTQLPDLRSSRGLAGAELTAIYLDKSEMLAEALKSCYANDGRKLLAELQFSFLSFVLCQSLQALNQWKAILQLMLGCEEAILAKADLFVKFAKCIRLQLAFGLGDDGRECWPENMLGDSFLRVCLVEFLQMVNDAAEAENGVDANLYQECQLLSKMVEEKLGWEIERDDCGEYAPVVVVLDQEQTTKAVDANQ